MTAAAPSRYEAQLPHGTLVQYIETGWPGAPTGLGPERILRAIIGRIASPDEKSAAGIDPHGSSTYIRVIVGIQWDSPATYVELEPGKLFGVAQYDRVHAIPETDLTRGR